MRHKFKKSLQIITAAAAARPHSKVNSFTFETKQFGSSLPTSDETIFHYSFEARPVSWIIQGNKGERRYAAWCTTRSRVLVC